MSDGYVSTDYAFRNWDRPYNRYNNNYGGGANAGTAIGQILGAILQRNADRKAAQDEVSLLTDAPNALNNGLDLGNQTHYQDNGGNTVKDANGIDVHNINGDFAGGNAYRQDLSLLGGTPAQLMGQVAPQQNVPTSANVGKGLLSGMTQPAQQGGLLSGATNPQTFFTMPTAPTAEQQQAQSDFTAAQQANPEWYRQGTTPNSSVYVGNRPDLAQNAIVDANGKVAQAQAQQVDPNIMGAQYNKANNPMSTSVSAPKTLQEQQAAINQQKAQAAQELYKKYGSNPQFFRDKVMPALNQSADNLMKQQTQNYTQQQINTLSQGLNGAKDVKSALPYVMQLSQLGVKVDPSLVKEAYSSPDLKIQAVDLGGTKQILSVNPKTGETKNLFTGEVTNTPYQTGKLAIDKQNADSNTTRAGAAVVNANRPIGTGTGAGSKSALEKYFTSQKFLDDQVANQTLYEAKMSGRDLMPSDEEKLLKQVKRLQMAQQGFMPDDGGDNGDNGVDE